MQRVVSSDLWRVAKAHAKSARRRRAAIAYVTQDLIGFRRGDTLLCDASPLATSCGETSAKLIRSLHEKGVSVFHTEGLHAKVLLLDAVAVIGSGNMSNSSATALVEAGIVTDQTSTVAGVASLIEQLQRQSRRLEVRDIDRLCQIKVVRRGGAPKQRAKQGPKSKCLGDRTWLVGVRELKRDSNAREQRMIDRANQRLSSQFGEDDEPAWVRWSGQGHFARESRGGDSLIQIWRSAKATRPSRVCRSTPVLLKQKAKTWTRFYTREVDGPYAEMSWGQFQRLLKTVGYHRKVGPGTVHLLEPQIAEAIDKKWKAFTRS